MPVTHGPVSKTPEGFENAISFLGRRIQIKFYRSIKDPPRNLDGYWRPDCNEIWVATFGRTPVVMADTLWHEVRHAAICYIRNKCNVEWLTTEQEESIVSLFELIDPAVLRGNEWLWRLLGPKKNIAS